jgi:hypothetical protein
MPCKDADKRILHPVAHELYQYVLGRRFDPGAMAEAFEPLTSLPPISLAGAGRIHGFMAGQLRPFQHPQVWFHPQTTLVGVPTTAGQLIGQPLIDLGD